MAWGDYSWLQLAGIGLPVLMMSMVKGGFPIASLAAPLMVLLWPSPDAAARRAVAFMLPMLCLMDIVAVLLYRRHIRWDLLRPIFPGMLLGVVLGTLLFVSQEKSLVSIPDRTLKMAIGSVGIIFVLYRIFSVRILRRLEAHHPGHLGAAGFGLTAGLTSTLAHAGGPVMHMYLLPRRLPKMGYAATTCGFFWVLNLVKVPPFIWGGRFRVDDLLLGALMLPLVPVGVLLGYGLVHITNPKAYVGLIYTALTVTSVMLIIRGLG